MKPAAFALLCLSGGALVAAQTEPAQVLKPGNGVTAPMLLKEVKPAYPSDALSIGLSGAVWLEAIVETDGSVGEVRVKESLFPSLDAAAVEAMKQWRFNPGKREGKPVRVAVDVEMTFTASGPGPRLDSPDVMKPGPGVTTPVPLKQVHASYAAAAMEARIQGQVTLEAVVLTDGSVGDIRVTRKLHPLLDAEAVRALKQWRFTPGQFNGKAVPVQVSVDMTFSIG